MLLRTCNPGELHCPVTSDGPTRNGRKLLTCLPSAVLGPYGNEWLARNNKYVSASTARSAAGVQRLSLHPHVSELVPSDQWAQLLCELRLSARHSPVLLRRTCAD